MSETPTEPAVAEADDGGAQGGGAADQATRTRVSFRWLRKMIIVWIVFAGAGAYFAYDGFLAYPARGRAFLVFAERDYLAAADSERMLTPTGVSVQEPSAQFRRLKDADPKTMSGFEKAQLSWLTALSRVESLEAIGEGNASLAPGQGSATVFPMPRARLDQAQQATANKEPPAPLAAYDIPSQHVIWVLCAVLLVWLTAKIIAAFTKVYRFDHETLTLTLPDGRSFTPEEIEDIDKRKWDKFLVFMRVRGIDGELKFDGLKYDYLEQWVLKMEKAWPGYEPEDEGAAEAAAEAGEGSGGERSA